jgi:hypothetical protein
MTQLSRPLQVALAAVGLFVIVWFVALRGHSGTEGSPSPVSAAASKPASAASGGSASSGSVYHGSAPGVEGLSRAIAKAHGAVSQSQQNAKQLEEKAAQASSPTGGTAASARAGAVTSSPATQRASTHSASKSSAASVPASGKATAPKSHAAQTPPGQVWVERQLKHRDVVALLFFNPKGAEDIRTRSELEHLITAKRGGRVSVEAGELGNARVVHASRHKRAERIVLRVASAGKVGSYGSFTRVASIYQTPTLLVIRPGGHIEPAMTGLADAFSIEQAISEQAQR